MFLSYVNMSINKKRKLGPKTVDCGFLAYAHHSIAYRFLVIKSKVSNVYVDIFLESRDVTFFKNIFPMKNLHNMSRLHENVIEDTTPEPFENFVHAEQTLEPFHEEIDDEAPRRSKRQKNAKAFGDDFIVYLMDDTLRTISEAFSSPDADDWKEAGCSEINSILSDRTWELVD
jgi:hypothetical protein